MGVKQKNGQEKKRGIPLSVYLCYMIVCTFIATGVSFCRYISTANGNDSSRVAAGIVDVTYADDTTIEMETPADDSTDIITKDFKFSVSNKSSEVAIQYDVVVKLEKALPEGVKLTLDDKTVSGEEGTHTFSNMGTFQAGEKEKREHTLSFTGDSEKIQQQFETNITVTVKAVQID